MPDTGNWDSGRGTAPPAPRVLVIPADPPPYLRLFDAPSCTIYDWFFDGPSCSIYVGRCTFERDMLNRGFAIGTTIDSLLLDVYRRV